MAGGGAARSGRARLGGGGAGRRDDSREQACLVRAVAGRGVARARPAAEAGQSGTQRRPGGGARPVAELAKNFSWGRIYINFERCKC